MISFVFLWVPEGPYKDTRYLDHITSQISRHYSKQKEFVCLTNHVHSIEQARFGGEDVCMVPLKTPWEIYAERPRLKGVKERYWCFSKIEAFRRDLDLCERAVLTDLDNFIVNPLDDLLSYNGAWGARQNFLSDRAHADGSVWQTSWVMFDPSKCHDLYDHASELGENGLPKTFKPFGGWGDQAFFSRYRPHPDYVECADVYGDDLLKLFPGSLTSLKWAQRNGEDYRRAAVVFAHGKPKPHELDWKLP